MKITGLWAEMVDEATADIRLEPISLDEAEEWIRVKRIEDATRQRKKWKDEGHSNACIYNRKWGDKACICDVRL